MTLNTHLLVLFFRLSMSSLRKRKPSWCAVCVGGWGTAGLLWAGADLDRRVVASPGSLGRGRRRGLGLSRARGRSGREDFSGIPLGRRGTSPRAWGWREVMESVKLKLMISKSLWAFDLAFCNVTVLKVSLHHLRLKLLKLLLESMHEVRSSICLHLQTREIFTKKLFLQKNYCCIFIYLIYNTNKYCDY